MQKAIAWLQNQWTVFWRWLFPIPGDMPWKTRWVEDFPDEDEYQPQVVYVVGEDDELWFVAMLCPCNCGKVLFMSLLEKDHPRWSLQDHQDGTVSLSPSVWRQVGCGSHFFLKKGLIQWCGSQ